MQDEMSLQELVGAVQLCCDDKPVWPEGEPKLDNCTVGEIPHCFCVLDIADKTAHCSRRKRARASSSPRDMLLELTARKVLFSRKPTVIDNLIFRNRTALWHSRMDAAKKKGRKRVSDSEGSAEPPAVRRLKRGRDDSSDVSTSSSRNGSVDRAPPAKRRKVEVKRSSSRIQGTSALRSGKKRSIKENGILGLKRTTIKKSISKKPSEKKPSEKDESASESKGSKPEQGEQKKVKRRKRKADSMGWLKKPLKPKTSLSEADKPSETYEDSGLGSEMRLETCDAVCSEPPPDEGEQVWDIEPLPTLASPGEVPAEKDEYPLPPDLDCLDTSKLPTEPTEPVLPVPPVIDRLQEEEEVVEVSLEAEVKILENTVDSVSEEAVFEPEEEVLGASDVSFKSSDISLSIDASDIKDDKLSDSLPLEDKVPEEEESKITDCEVTSPTNIKTDPDPPMSIEITSTPSVPSCTVQSPIDVNDSILTESLATDFPEENVLEPSAIKAELEKPAEIIEQEVEISSDDKLTKEVTDIEDLGDVPNIEPTDIVSEIIPSLLEDSRENDKMFESEIGQICDRSIEDDLSEIKVQESDFIKEEAVEPPIVTECNGYHIEEDVKEEEMESQYPVVNGVSPERQALKDDLLKALGLTSLKAEPVPQMETKPAVSQSQPLTSQSSASSGYTGTLKAVIKLNRGDKKSRSMVFKNQDQEKLEYQICSDASGDASGVPITHLAEISKTKDKIVTDYDTVSNSQYVSAPPLGDGSCDPLDDKGKESNLVIPEKSSSFSIHPERLCSDVCCYCFGKFGSLDTPCHVAQLKGEERQKNILKNEPYLTLESCLCDACYRYVDRKSNCPGPSKSKKAKSPVSSICCVTDCSETATHTVKRKWLLKIKRSLANKFEIDMEKHNGVYTPLCTNHHYCVDHYMVCGICRKRLNRNHLFTLGPETEKLNVLLAEDGIPAKLSDKLFLCKLCRYYTNLRLKYSDPSLIPTSSQPFYKNYRKKILGWLDVPVSESEEEEEEEKEKEEKEQDEGTDMDDMIALSGLANLLGDNSNSAVDTPSTQASQPRIQVKFGNVNIGTLSNLNIGQHGRPEQRPPPLPLSCNLDFQGPTTPDGSWEKVQSTLQFDRKTKALWQELQRPYGNQSSFLRHLVMLEKIWRGGNLVLAPRADPRAAKYITSVQTRIKSLEGREAQVTPSTSPAPEPVPAPQPAPQLPAPPTPPPPPAPPTPPPPKPTFCPIINTGEVEVTPVNPNKVSAVKIEPKLGGTVILQRPPTSGRIEPGRGAPGRPRIPDRVLLNRAKCLVRMVAPSPSPSPTAPATATRPILIQQSSRGGYRGRGGSRGPYPVQQQYAMQYQALQAQLAAPPAYQRPLGSAIAAPPPPPLVKIHPAAQLALQNMQVAQMQHQSQQQVQQQQQQTHHQTQPQSIQEQIAQQQAIYAKQAMIQKAAMQQQHIQQQQMQMQKKEQLMQRQQQMQQQQQQIQQQQIQQQQMQQQHQQQMQQQHQQQMQQQKMQLQQQAQLMKVGPPPPYPGVPAKLPPATTASSVGTKVILPGLPPALTITQRPASITLPSSGITIEKQSDGFPILAPLPPEKPIISVFREPNPNQQSS